MARSVELGSITTGRSPSLPEDSRYPAAAHSVQLADYSARLHRICEFWQSLPDKPDETPEAVLRSLWLAAAGQPRSCTLAAQAPLPPISYHQSRQLDDLIEARRQGTPLAHLTGRQHFMGLELLAGPDALIPRKETEILANAAIERIRRCVAANGTALVLDICTGSGNLPLAYAAHIAEDLRLYGADLSEDAVNAAQRNAQRLNLSHRIEFRCGDMFAPFEADQFISKADVISCNPPYISTAQVAAMPHETAGHEPRMAFNGGPFGVSILLRAISEAPRYLKPGGWLLVEVGAGQGPAIVRRLASRPDVAQVQTHLDATGEIRAIAAQWQP